MGASRPSLLRLQVFNCEMIAERDDWCSYFGDELTTIEYGHSARKVWRLSPMLQRPRS